MCCQGCRFVNVHYGARSLVFSAHYCFIGATIIGLVVLWPALMNRVSTVFFKENYGRWPESIFQLSTCIMCVANAWMDYFVYFLFKDAMQWKEHQILALAMMKNILLYCSFAAVIIYVFLAHAALLGLFFKITLVTHLLLATWSFHDILVIKEEYDYQKIEI